MNAPPLRDDLQPRFERLRCARYLAFGSSFEILQRFGPTMAQRRIGRTLRARSEEDAQDTRQTLLEAAGQVFAEKGFEGATAKEITERARVNTAAVNYHFGGIEQLYAAVLEEAQNRLLAVQKVEKALSRKTDRKEQFDIVVHTIVETLLGPVSSSWVLRVIARDMMTASPTREAAKEKLVLPRARALRIFVGDLLDLPEDHPAVARACVTVMAPLFLLVLGNRRMMKRALPNLGLEPTDAPALAEHLSHFAIAGLEAIAKDARKSK